MSRYVGLSHTKILGLTSIFLVGHCSLSAAAGSPHAGYCVIAFGDSTTFGYSTPNCYPRKLAYRLFERGISATVINSGVNGDTTAGARERFERDVIAHKPNLVVIQFGLNDQTVRLYQRPEEVDSYLTEDQFSANLRYFISELRQRGIQVILVTPNPMCWTPTLERHYPEGPYLDGPRGGNLLLRHYVVAERELAVAERAPLADVFEEYDRFETTTGRPVNELFLEDGVHPNEAGYDLNVELLLRELLPLVKAETSGSSLQATKPLSIIHDGRPISAYVVGWGCRGRDGYFELTRTEHELNPEDCLSAPRSPGKEDWTLQLELTALARSEWAIQLGDSGRITFSAVNGEIAVDGPIFRGSAKDLFAEEHSIASRPISLELIRKGGQLRLGIDGRNVGVVELGSVDIGSIGIAPTSGSIRVRNFRLL